MEGLRKAQRSQQHLLQNASLNNLAITLSNMFIEIHVVAAEIPDKAENTAPEANSSQGAASGGRRACWPRMSMRRWNSRATACSTVSG